MNGDGATTGALKDPARAAQLSVLLACFAGSKSATKARREMNKKIREGGRRILDEVVLKVSATRMVQIHDPRRTVAGALTPALTWGLFGLLAGGLQGLGVWAVLGALCGGLYAHFTEHLLTKDELKRIGERLPKDSSAVAVFVQGSHPEGILSSAASFGTTTASVASIASDLSAKVYSGAMHQVETADTTGVAMPAGAQTTELSMVLVRFEGERAARQSLRASSSAKSQDPAVPQVELVVEANKEARRRVVDPATGTAAMSTSDVISWGGFGLVWGAIVGFVGNGGALGALEDGVVTGIAWAMFGLVAGALYGMWAGRAVSARRLKGVGPLIPPDSSMVVAWVGATVEQDAIDRWAAAGSQRLTVRFVPVGQGAHLEV